MKEIIETISDELRRIASEGDAFVSLDDKSVEILKKLAGAAAQEAPQRAAPSQARPQKKAVPEEFVDDVKPMEFVSEVDMVKLDGKDDAPKKVKIVENIDGIAAIPKPKPFELPEGGKREQWEWLRDRVLNDPVCHEHLKPGKKVVFGVGNLDAKIFFCGEAPGADEEIQGEPFVGKAGQLLTKIIATMGLTREEVYIGNIMNWRPEVPKGNRPPTEEEMNYCLPYLKAQIAIVKPQIIVALGMTAVNGLLGFDPTRRMGKIRGTWQQFEGRDLMCTYHPSFLLQHASASMKRLAWEDMMTVMERAGMPVSEKQRGYFLPKQ